MKKSCQLYNLLFCKGDDVMGCTINVAILFYCTKMERHFGALRFGQLTGVIFSAGSDEKTIFY
jgi:hypothetical protein